MPRRVCVCVLGDLGRSPRMIYHTTSLLDAGFDVDLVGYEGIWFRLDLLMCVL